MLWLNRGYFLTPLCDISYRHAIGAWLYKDSCLVGGTTEFRDIHLKHTYRLARCLNCFVTRVCDLSAYAEFVRRKKTCSQGNSTVCLRVIIAQKFSFTWTIMTPSIISNMMTLSNGYIFRVSGPFMKVGGPLNALNKGQWRGDLMFLLICAWTNDRATNQNAGDLRHHRAHYEVTVIKSVWSPDT